MSSPIWILEFDREEEYSSHASVTSACFIVSARCCYVYHSRPAGRRACVHAVYVAAGAVAVASRFLMCMCSCLLHPCACCVCPDRFRGMHASDRIRQVGPRSSFFRPTRRQALYYYSFVELIDQRKERPVVYEKSMAGHGPRSPRGRRDWPSSMRALALVVIDCCCC